MEDTYKGKDLMLAVEQMDCVKLLDFAHKNKSKKSSVTFKGLMSELSDGEIQELWGGLSRGVEERTKHLLLPPTTNKQLQQEVCLFLQAAIDLGVAYFEHYHSTDTPTSTHLLSIVVHLNSTLLELPSSLEALKNSIAGLCEKMFLSKEQLYQDHVCLNTLLYILRRSLVQRAAKKEVKRVFALRPLLPRLLSSPEVLPLIKKAAQSPLYIGMLEGQKIIKVALTADVDHVAEIHEAIKQRLATCTLSQATAYGKIYFHGWVYAVKKNLPDLKTELEMTCIQNIMLLAIQGRQKQLVANLRKVLAQFHSQKKEMFVSRMLYFLYQPILWRYIKNPDGVVRANAAQLFLDVFPLDDPDACMATTEQELCDQMLIIKDLLLDDFPIVRCTSVIGLCIAMSVNWELFTEDMLKTYFKIIINDLSCDSSSSDVRLAVAKGLKVVLENPLTLCTMEKILPKVRHLFHDISEAVRVAFCQLLIRVKRIASIKYFSIVPVEHILARLEEDLSLSRPLVSLLLNSYFPANESPALWIHRCVELVKDNREASRIFFTHCSSHISLESAAQFMKRAVECIHFYVKSKACSKQICVLSSTPASQGKDKKGNKKDRPIEEEALGLHDPKIVCGLLDGVAIMWLANLKEMEQPENKPLMKKMVGKLTKILGELSIYYKDSDVWQSVYYLAKYMPALPALAPLCFVRLQSLPPSAPEEEYLTLLECLCAQEGASLIQLLREWIGEGLLHVCEPSAAVDKETSAVDKVKPPAAKKRRKSKKKLQEEEEQKKKEEQEKIEEANKEGQHHLAVRLLGAALDRRSCQKALLITNPEALTGVLHSMEDIKRKVELCMDQEVREKDAEFLRDLLMLLLKIAVLLRGEDKFGAVKFVEDVLSWFQTKIFLPPAPNSSTRKSAAFPTSPTPSFQKMVNGMCEDLCTVMSDMTLLGFLNMKSLKFLKFAMNLLQLDEFGGGCLLQPVCRLLLRHVTYGAYALTLGEEGAMLRIVPDCFAKIFQHLEKEEFFESVPQAHLKECGSLLSAALQQLEGELLSAVTLSLLRAILHSTPASLQHCEHEEWNAFEKLSISAAGTILLSIVCTKPKMIVSFLQQLQKHVAKTEMDSQSWLACFAIVNTIQEYKKSSKGIRRELVLLLESMEDGLKEPLKTLDPNVAPSPPLDSTPSLKDGPPPLSFAEHCLSQCSQLKERLTKRVDT